MSTHAPFAPSAMERIALCPGSYKACVDAPQDESEYAKDGTEAHSALSYALENGIHDVGLLRNFLNSPIHTWQHRRDTAAEREQAVQDALDYVYEILDVFEDAEMYVEKRVQFPSLVTDKCWGTADIIIVIPCIETLHVIDFKYGAGKYVTETENLQVGTYATAALDLVTEAGHKVTIVDTTIVQPRAFSASGPIRHDVRSAEYFAHFFREKIDNIITAALADDAMLVAGDAQCQFCPRKADCPAREAAALAVVGDTFKSVKDVSRAGLPAVSSMSPERMAYVKSAAEVLKGWIADVEAAAYNAAIAGQVIPGFKLVEAAPRRRWYEDSKTTAESIMLLSGADIDTVMPRKLMTITDAEKLVVDAHKKNAPRGQKTQAAEEAKRVMADLTTKESSGTLSLVPIDDKRPAINLVNATFSSVAIPPPQPTE